jgi:iron complex transport system permease protein
MSSSINRNQATHSSTSFSRARSRRPEARAALSFCGAIVLLLLLAMMALAVGAFPVSPRLLASLFWTKLHGLPEANAAANAVIFAIRGPRILGAALVGAALSSAGAAYQGLFRNPLVSPDILGVSSGAALGAATGIFLDLPVAGIEATAFLGGLMAVLAAYGVAASIRGRDPVLVLVLSGVVIGSLMGSGVALLKFLADSENQLPAITFWLLGSLAAFNRRDLAVIALPVAAALVPLVLLRWQLDVMTIGDEEATALGVRVRIVRGVVVLAATLMTAAAVAVSGIVGWVGLVVPHIARLAVGPAFARLLPMAALLGAAFLLLVDTAARTLGTVELPLGVLTAVIGTPVFLLLLARSGRGWN